MKRAICKALIICGITVMAGLSTVGAASLYQTVTATLRPDIIIKLEKDTLNLKNSEGKTITPVVIDGSTYLPIRAIANSIGLNVNWDEKTQTIGLEKHITVPNENEKIGVRGTVKNIVRGKDGITFLVEGNMDSDTQYSSATVTANRNTTIIKDGIYTIKALDYSEINEGDVVEVKFKGEVSESNPVMGVADTVKILNVKDLGNSNINSRVKAPDVSGKILEVKEDGKLILVDSKDTTINGQVWVTITKETNFFENISEDAAIGYRNVSRNFEVGNHVEIIVDGPVLYSYPARAAATAVTVNEK